MAKKPVQDILPPDPEKRSVRNIPIGSRKKIEVTKSNNYGSSTNSEPEYKLSSDLDSSLPEESAVEVPIPRRKREYLELEKRKLSKIILWVLAVFSVVVVFFAILSFFVSAEVTITPKQQKMEINSLITARKEASSGELQYEVIKVSKDLGKEVVATGEEKVEEKASGKIIIYNKYNSKNQKLIKTTRFQTPGSLIYRIAEDVIVPGTSSKNGETIPGQIEVTVYADATGTDYNIGLSDFTIPGFKGDPRFDDFYARSVTPMTGGFSGTRKKITTENKDKTTSDLEDSLKTSLVQIAKSQIPPEFALYDTAFTFEFESLPQTSATESTVTINERGTAYGMMINKKSLINYIAKNILKLSDAEEIDIINLADIVFTSKNGSFSPQKNSDLSFTLSGEASVVWLFDQSKIKQDLAGKSRKEMESVLSQYGPSIEKAEAVISPFWSKTFPKKLDNIKIKINID